MNNLSIAFSLINLLRHWLESIEIKSPLLARTCCQLIPASCPFERQFKLFDRTIVSIPPLCKLNPFYEQLMLLRFKSLVYLAEECQEDTALYYQSSSSNMH